MSDTVFTCGHVLCIIDGISLYDVEQTYEYTRMLGEYLTGVPAPSPYMNTEKIAEISIWTLALNEFCGDNLKRQMVRQHPAAFHHTQLNALIQDETLTDATLVRLYREKAKVLGIQLDKPLTLEPLTYNERQKFLQLVTDPVFRQTCLRLLQLGTEDYISELA